MCTRCLRFRDFKDSVFNFLQILLICFVSIDGFELGSLSSILSLISILGIPQCFPIQQKLAAPPLLIPTSPLPKPRRVHWSRRLAEYGMYHRRDALAGSCDSIESHAYIRVLRLCDSPIDLAGFLGVAIPSAPIPPSGFARVVPSLMCGCYYHLNNLRFNKSQNNNDVSAAHVVMCVVSSDIMECRWLKWLWDHPFNHVPCADGVAARKAETADPGSRAGLRSKEPPSSQGGIRKGGSGTKLHV